MRLKYYQNLFIGAVIIFTAATAGAEVRLLEDVSAGNISPRQPSKFEQGFSVGSGSTKSSPEISELRRSDAFSKQESGSSRSLNSPLQSGMSIGSDAGMLKDVTRQRSFQADQASAPGPSGRSLGKELISGGSAPGLGTKAVYGIARGLGDLSGFQTGFDPQIFPPWSEWLNESNPFQPIPIDKAPLSLAKSRQVSPQLLQQTEHYKIQRDDDAVLVTKKIDYMIAGLERVVKKANDNAGFYPQSAIDKMMDDAVSSYSTVDKIYADIGFMYEDINKMYGALDRNYESLNQYESITTGLADAFNTASGVMADHVRGMAESVEKMSGRINGEISSVDAMLKKIIAITGDGEDTVKNYDLLSKEISLMEKDVKSSMKTLKKGGIDYEERGEAAGGYLESIEKYFKGLKKYSENQLDYLKKIRQYLEGIKEYLEKVRKDLHGTLENLKETEDYFRGAVIQAGVPSSGSDVCASAEPAGMSGYRDCSTTCLKVCRFKKKVGDTDCYECPSGSPDSCFDVGAWPDSHPWCQPGGICHKSPEMYCTPFGTFGPQGEPLQCTNCKKRPDMCWQKVKDGTTSYTNCKLGCWNGKCEYVGKYEEFEWDGTKEFLHCYECVVPPPKTCETMGWGYDWEMNCKLDCPKPKVCVEEHFTEDEGDDDDDRDDGGEGGEGEDGGGGAPADQDADDDKDDGKDDEEGTTTDEGDEEDTGGKPVDPPGGTPEQPDGGAGAVAGGQPTDAQQPVERETPVPPGNRPGGGAPEQPAKPDGTRVDVDQPPNPPQSPDDIIDAAEAAAEEVIAGTEEAALEASGAYNTRNMQWLESRLRTVDEQIQKREEWLNDPDYAGITGSITEQLEDYYEDRERILEQMEEEKQRVRDEIEREREDERRRQEDYERSVERWRRRQAMDREVLRKIEEKELKEFEEANNNLNSRAEELQTGLTNRSNRLNEMERRIEAIDTEIKYRKEEQIDNDDYDQTSVENEIEKLEAELIDLVSRYQELKDGYEEFEREAKREINQLMSEYRKELFDVDEGARRRAEAERIDEFMMWYEDLRQLKKVREVSDATFERITSELQSKIDEARASGDEDLAEELEEELENITRGKEEWDAVYQRREDTLEDTLSDLSWRNYEEGAGPTEGESLTRMMGDYADLYDQEIEKFENLASQIENGIANGTIDPSVGEPGGDLEKVRAHIDALSSARDDLRNNESILKEDPPLTRDHVERVIESATEVAERSRGEGEHPTFAEHFIKALGEEMINNLNPLTQVKKSAAFGWGLVQGTASAVYGLGELVVGAVDLTMESYAQWLGFEDGGIFGTDASDTLYSVIAGVGGYGSQGFDGIVQATVDAGGIIDGKLKELERARDIDWATAEAGGKVAGEVILGEALIEAGLGRLGRLGAADDIVDAAADAQKVADNIGDGTRVGQLDADLGIPDAPRTPDIDTTPPVTPDTTGAPPRTPDVDTAPTRGPDADIDDATRTRPDSDKPDAPDEPDIPSNVRDPDAPPPPPPPNRFDNTQPLPESGRRAKPLDENTLTELETRSGFRRDHAARMDEFAQEHDVFLVVRDGNVESIKFFDDPDMMPKPMSSKAKTAQVGPPENRGRVVNPRNETQARYWDDAIRDAENAGDTAELERLRNARKKAEEAWDHYGDEMLQNGYFENPDGSIGYKDPVTGETFTGVHGDYDLHGVYRRGENGMEHVDYGSGQHFDENGVDIEGGPLRSQLADAIDTNKPFVRHGGQDDWVPDPTHVPVKKPDPPVTVFFPDGRLPRRLETPEEMQKFYEDEMGVEWPYQDYRGTRTGEAPSAPDTPDAPDAPDIPPPRDFDGDGLTNVGPDSGAPTNLDGPIDGTPPPPKNIDPEGVTADSDVTMTGPAANSQIKVVDHTTGETVTYNTAERLGGGSSSSVYASADNADDAIRITRLDHNGRSVQLDETGRSAVESIQGPPGDEGVIRIVEQRDLTVVRNSAGSQMNDRVVEVVENMKQGTARDVIANQPGGRMTDGQARALDRATRELNNNGYAWLDNHDQNYTFEQIGDGDEWRVVVMDGGGIVPMKGGTLAEKAANARVIQTELNVPRPDYRDGIRNIQNPEMLRAAGGPERTRILEAHGNRIDIEATGLQSVNDIEFYPGGMVNHSQASDLFKMTPDEAAVFYGTSN